MKITLLFLLSCCFFQLHAQDSLKIKHIDSLVNVIVHSEFPTQKDSIVQNQPQLGLEMTTYLTMATFGKEIKKYINIVKNTVRENEKVKLVITGTAFYYDENKLIKVEEFMASGETEKRIYWYFEDDKCFSNTAPGDGKWAERPALLISMSNALLLQMKK